MKIGLLTLIIMIGFAVNGLAQTPNILLIIADDLGVDYSHGYHHSSLLPSTPTLDSLRSKGITFDNVFATPKCTPSRATIMSGKHGIKTNVLGTPGHLSIDHISIFQAIENETNGAYSDAVIGKWHIAQPADPNHPADHAVDYYTGLLTAMVDDYYAWDRTEFGQTTIDSTYVTTALTNAAIDWVDDQSKPWFLWLAHVAPHAPYHKPPDTLFTIGSTGNNQRKFTAAIEAMDYEIGRLLNSLSTEELENTLIMFLGDNGSPNGVLQNFPNGHGKSTLYQGGIKVPLIISGFGVSRKGARETALIHITDIYATLLEFVGADLPGGIYNSLSFKHLLDESSNEPTRDYNYSEIVENGMSGFAIRNERYKLIQSLDNSTQEFYDLFNDSLETNNLIISGLSDTEEIIKLDLESEAQQLRSAWSCRDHIKNGDEEDIDCGGTFCNPCQSSATDILLDLNDVQVFPNPFKKHLEVISQTHKVSVRVLDVLGVSRIQFNTPKHNHKLNLSTLAPGLYQIVITDATLHKSIAKKVIKY